MDEIEQRIAQRIVEFTNSRYQPITEETNYMEALYCDDLVALYGLWEWMRGEISEEFSKDGIRVDIEEFEKLGKKKTVGNLAKYIRQLLAEKLCQPPPP